MRGGPAPLAADATAPERPAAGRLALAAWCLFDWANHAFPSIVVTYVFAAYFTKAVAPTPEEGTALWGQTLSLAGIAIALTSPVLGAIADQSGRRKPWLAALMLVCAAATAALWFVRPGSDVRTALPLMAIGVLAYELAIVFYNAMLPDLAPPRLVGRLSGWGWGCGYGGGLACLAVALLLLVQPATPPFGLDRAQAEPVRATVFLAAAWMIVFALPLFLLAPDRCGRGVPMGRAVRDGIGALWRTLMRLPRHPNLALFLLAKMVFTDGLNTLFAFGGIYAAGTFAMAPDELLVFGILLNVVAGAGAAGFAWVDDRLGAKPTILIALAALTVLGVAILPIRDKTLFYVLALGIGLFIGPAQAASRSLMARLAPPELRAEFFGLFALAGKATAFVGPAAVFWVTRQADSQRAGMGVIPVFFVVGLLLLMRVREPRR